MNSHEKYFFDINGYLVVPRILSLDRVAVLNEAIDNNLDRVRVRSEDSLLSRNSPALVGTHGRSDISGILNWPQPWCQPFRDLLSFHPALHYMLDLIGDEFHFGNANGISMTAGTEGCVLHGGGTLVHKHAYRYVNGRMWNNLVGVCYQLADINPGDGGFVCVPGSHKANIDTPDDVLTMEYDLGCYHHIPMKAGDALIFTEALTHGTLPWKGKHERRTLLYRYAAGGFVNPKGHNRIEEYCPFYDELTPLQQAIMEPPYNAGRPNIAVLMAEQ